MIRMRSILFGLAVVLLSAGSAPAQSKPAAGVEAETEYFAVFMGGKKVGYAKHIRRVAGGKVTTVETMVVTIGRGGVALTAREVERHVETVGGKPLAFKSVQDMGILITTIEGTVSDGKLTATITTGRNVQKRIMDWPDGAMMSEALRLLERKKGLGKGTTYTAKAFSASLLQFLDAEVSVGGTEKVDLLGRVVPLTKVTAVLKAPTGEMTATSYIDRNYRLQKSVVPMIGINIELVACNRQFAMSKDEAVDFFDKLLLSPPKALAGVASAKAITYTLVPTPAAKTKLRFPSTDNQTVRPGAGGRIILTVRPVRPAAGATFPYKGKDKTALAALKSTQFLQCNDKKIKALARKAVGDTKDAAEAVRRIEAFVGKYINKKDLSVGYASAIEVADSRQGDCSEHAVLAAALCRAVGIPAQVVTGLAYVEEFGSKKGVFGPHAWNRALVGGKWVGFDAALTGYDAGHITLATDEGSPNDFFGAIATLGYFKIEKAAVQK